MSEAHYGRFIWHDLVTSDLHGAQEFYAELFGWTIQVETMAFGDYSMILLDGCGIGGMVELDPAQRAPAHWMGYVTVGDVDQAVAQARELGAQVVNPGVDIPDVGRFGVLLDPQGAVISPMALKKAPEPPPATHRHGQFCWDELLTNDAAGAARFYASIFGYEPREIDMGPNGTYTVFARDGKDRAGMMQMPPEAPAPPHWVAYVAAADIDAATSKVKELGGKVWHGPASIPGVGRFSVCADLQQATFAMFKGAD